MHLRKCHVRVALIASCASLALTALTVGPAQARPGGPGHGHGHGHEHGHGAGDPARAVLPEGDGWASADGGTTGGSAAERDHVFTVTNRAELVAALNDGDDTPKIIKIKGVIAANTDDAGSRLDCEDYRREGYTLEKYLDAYDPGTWGEEEPSGPMEEARQASAEVQEERVELFVPSNTTLIGVGDDAGLLGASLQIKDVDNVIVRNLTVEDAYDCFPAWDPGDGDSGNWNSEYDNTVVTGSTHVWLDHNTFTDGRRPDSEQPEYFGRPFQQHDGLVDIVRGADLVTATWNVFTEHSKTVLIGNSDSAGDTDRGKLRSTFHHNLFRDLQERAPRVRFGQVDVYNNHFEQSAEADYGYTWGIGKEGALVAEHNAFTLPDSIGPEDTIQQWTPGTSMTESDNYVNKRPVDLLTAYNDAHPDAVLGDDAGWTPTLRPHVDSPRAVPRLVERGAGAGSAKLSGPGGPGGCR